MAGKVAIFALLMVAVSVSGFSKGGKIKLCARYCPPTGKPVCGTNGKTYTSECHLQNESCGDRELSVRHVGPCPPPLPEPIVCAKYCPPSRVSVCGSDGKTYSSQCHLSNAQCGNPQLTLKHQGPCPPPVCIKYCPPGGRPVCGSDRKTYDSQCHLSNAQCGNSGLTLDHPGPCLPRLCAKYCPPNGQSVCGSDGKTYNSKCHFENAHCSSTHVSIRHNGPCPPPTTKPPIVCARYCPPTGKAVCGTDGNTYTSECHLKNKSCGSPHLTVSHVGPCRKNCPGVCPLIFNPVCGSDGKTYSNDCDLESAVRCDDLDIRKVHNGHCRERKTGSIKG